VYLVPFKFNIFVGIQAYFKKLEIQISLLPAQRLQTDFKTAKIQKGSLRDFKAT
jgi:hypothetical protein